MVDTSEKDEMQQGGRSDTADRSSGGLFVLGVLLGAAVGAILGLLYAPRPGVETRREWERRSEELRRRAEEAAEKAARRAEEFAERARQYAAKAEKAAGLHRGSGAVSESEGGPAATQG